MAPLRSRARPGLGAGAVVVALAVALVAGCTGGQGGARPPSNDAARVPDGTLTILPLLPSSGDLAYAGVAGRAAVAFGVDQVNAAGGVLGHAVSLEPAVDTASDPARSSRAVSRIAQHPSVDAVVGPDGSPQVAATLGPLAAVGVPTCSPAATVTWPGDTQRSLFARTVPADDGQASVLAGLVPEDARRVAIVARDDSYGQGLARAVAGELQRGGRAPVAISTTANDAEVSAAADAVSASGADAVVVIELVDRGAAVLRALAARGVTPVRASIVGSDGLADPTLAVLVDAEDPTALDGMAVVGPVLPGPSPTWVAFTATYPSFADADYVAQTIDCTTLLALAAERAGSDDGRRIAAHLTSVTRRGAPACGTFAECAPLVRSGEDVDYVGLVGPFWLDDHGDPRRRAYEVSRWSGGELVADAAVEADA